MAFSQTWKANADSLIVKHVASGLIGQSDIFAFPETLTSTDSILLSDGTFIHVPYSNCYAYFFDLIPFANWGHACQYCFVNASLNHTIVQAEAPPMETSLVDLAICPRPSPNPKPVAADTTFVRNLRSNDTRHLWAVLICGNHTGNDAVQFWFDLSSVYTVLTNVYGYQEGQLNNGFVDRRIIATAPSVVRDLYNGGQFSGELNGNATVPIAQSYGDFFNWIESDKTCHSKQNIENVFKCFAGDAQCLQDYEDQGLRELTPEDQLFVYITGHGYKNNNGCYFLIEESTGNPTTVYDTTLTRWLRSINCSQMTLLMQNCHSGGFIEKFLDEIDNPNCRCKNRIGQSATSKNNLSWSECYSVYQERSKGLSSSMVSEFTYYWTSAALGYYPYFYTRDTVVCGPWTFNNRVIGSGNMIWSDYFDDYENTHPHILYDVDPDTDDDGILSLNELFEFANNLDTWSRQGYYYPNYNDTINMETEYTPDDPQQRYESIFTKEAATLRGYEGQIDSISNSGTVFQPYRLCGDLYVNSDAELTMWDEVQSPENVKICVKPSGKLFLDGCTLTNLPGTGKPMWTGVQVWGDASKHQYAESHRYWQGYLQLTKGATISNAVVGIDVWKPEDDGTTGGIVKATDAHFINNATAVRFPPYENNYTVPGHPNTQLVLDNVSSFSNCEFTVDSGFLGNAFGNHADLYKVRGVGFHGCDFVLSNRAYATTAMGIQAIDAGFKVDGICSNPNIQPCPTIDNSMFAGFETAALSSNTGASGAYAVTITNTDFVGNKYGYYTVGSGFTTVRKSTFTMGRGDDDCTVGIYVGDVNSFSIEMDTFRPMAQAPELSFGVAVKDSKAQNLIQNNVFNNLLCANYSEGRNNTAPPPTPGLEPAPIFGLEYRCNENAGNQYDFLVQGGISIYQLGIQPNQGGPGRAANNTFSQGVNSIHFINGGTSTVNYFYDPTLANGTPTSTTAVNLVPTNDTVGCASPGGGTTNDTLPSRLSEAQRMKREADYLTAYSTYNALKDVYDQKIDGGDTRAEIASVQAATPADLWALRARLLGDSPYLSFDVLRNAADRDDILPQSVLFEILSSNPDELRRDTLISYLRSKDNPLPEYMVAVLQQVANGVTARTALEAQMARYSQEYRQAAGDIVRSILNDTVLDKSDLVVWLGNMHDIGSDRQIVSVYLEEGDIENAVVLAEMLPVLYGLEGEDLEEHGYYMEMLNLYVGLHNDGRNTMQLDSDEMALVERILDEGTGIAQAMAQAVRMAYGFRTDWCSTHVLNVMGDRGVGNRSYLTSINEGSLGSALGLCVNVSPNPARTWVAVDYTLPTGANKARMTIANTLGRVVLECDLASDLSQKILDLRGLKAGVYSYSVSCGGFSQSGKIVIVR